MTQFYEAVQRGAKWLDEKDPEWALKIDVANLEMKDCSKCVIGQIYGLYSEMLRIGILPEPVYHGFATGIDKEVAWTNLRDEWITVIKERVDQGVPLGEEITFRAE